MSNKISDMRNLMESVRDLKEAPRAGDEELEVAIIQFDKELNQLEIKADRLIQLYKQTQRIFTPEKAQEYYSGMLDIEETLGRIAFAIKRLTDE